MEKPLESFCSGEQALPVKKLSIDFNTDYCRKRHPCFESDIEKLWIERTRENINLFNKSKFRLHGLEIMRDNEVKVTDVKLQVGLTSYKDFIGTNMSPLRLEILRAGAADFNNFQAYMADPIGVGAIVQTCDDYFLFIERSDTVAEAPGMICRPGGHPEPEDIEYSADKLELLDPFLIAKEIYDSALNEIRDELNIPVNTLSTPLLLGVGFNPATANRPSFEFYVKCSLSGKEAQEKYGQQTQIEKDETKSLKLVSKEFLLMPKFPVQQKNFWDMLTHAAQCAILLYSEFAKPSNSLKYC